MDAHSRDVCVMGRQRGQSVPQNRSRSGWLSSVRRRSRSGYRASSQCVAATRLGTGSLERRAGRERLRAMPFFTRAAMAVKVRKAISVRNTDTGSSSRGRLVDTGDWA